MVPPAVLAAMRHIIYCPFEKLFSFSLPAGALGLLGAVTERYLLYHMQKKPKSLEVYHSLRTDPRPACESTRGRSPAGRKAVRR